MASEQPEHGAVRAAGWPLAFGTFVSPALADLDHDGNQEVIISRTDGLLSVQNHDGTLVPGWPVFGAAPGSFTSAAVGDVDSDGQLEIVAGAGQGPFTTDPFATFTFEIDGTLHPGFPFTTRSQHASLHSATLMPMARWRPYSQTAGFEARTISTPSAAAEPSEMDGPCSSTS